MKKKPYRPDVRGDSHHLSNLKGPGQPDNYAVPKGLKFGERSGHGLYFYGMIFPPPIVGPVPHEPITSHQGEVVSQHDFYGRLNSRT